MDQYRAAACLDLLNGILADDRIALGQLDTVDRDTDESDTDERQAGVGDDLDDDGGPNGADPPAAQQRAPAKVRAPAPRPCSGWRT